MNIEQGIMNFEDQSVYPLTLADTSILTGHLAQPVFKVMPAGDENHTLYARSAGLKKYELKDHLGNVRVVVSDRLTASGPLPGITNDAELLSYNHYYPFGMLQPGRNFAANTYRFGFNGKEMDNAWHGSTGTVYDYGFRIYDARVAKFLSEDPLTQEFPWWTPYQFAGNTPIQALDLDGLEILDYRSSYRITVSSGESYISFKGKNDGTFTPLYFKKQGIKMNDFNILSLTGLTLPNSLNFEPQENKAVMFDKTRAMVDAAMGRKIRGGYGEGQKYIRFNDNYGPARAHAIIKASQFLFRFHYEYGQLERDQAFADYNNMKYATETAFDMVWQDLNKSKTPGVVLEKISKRYGVSREQFITDLSQYIMDGTYSNPFDPELEKEKFSNYTIFIENTGKDILDSNKKGNYLAGLQN